MSAKVQVEKRPKVSIKRLLYSSYITSEKKIKSELKYHAVKRKYDIKGRKRAGEREKKKNERKSMTKQC